MPRRAIIMVLDGVGTGEMPDARDFGESTNANTLGHVAEAVGGLSLPNLKAMGLGNMAEELVGYKLKGVDPVAEPAASFGYASEKSKGKDTMTGHFEMIGIIRDVPFVTYPGHFPPDLIERIERAIGRRVIECGHASGTEVIKEYGQESFDTGHPIVYTSADSVLQVAAHEDIISPSNLYKICRTIREIMRGEHEVGRIIARPFTTRNGVFVRTERRRDFGLMPPSPNLLTILNEAGYKVMACGKIDDIFSMCGITDTKHFANNKDIFEATLEFMETSNSGLIFTNLIDFDQLYGHRNDPENFAKALEDFDFNLPRLTEMMSDEDLLIITADHGNDPTTLSTDHDREYVPLIAFAKNKAGVSLGMRESLSDIGATICEFFNLSWPIDCGESFLKRIFSK